ncbi:uncharacterized protein [Chlorocebus sabaeus]|uniref:uncharacterized protein n=1 Tax=Chlorocebus sabaeus TaxID=60711 RepID=UPI003BF9A096
MSILAALEEPLSPPLHCGSLSGLAEAGAGSLSLRGGVQGEAQAEPGLRASPTVQREFRRAPHSERPPAHDSEELGTGAGSCGGCTESPSSADPRALRSSSRRASPASLRGTARDRGPAARHARTPPCGGLPRGPNLPDQHSPLLRGTRSHQPPRG